MDEDLKLVERLIFAGKTASQKVIPTTGTDIHLGALSAEAAATITRLVKERDEAQEGLDRLEAAYGTLSDVVFGAYPKITAMAKELSEAQAGEMRAIAREVYERLRAETAEAQRDAAVGALRPLAECEIIESDTPLPDSDSARYFMTMGEIRAARAASRAGGGE